VELTPDEVSVLGEAMEMMAKAGKRSRIDVDSIRSDFPGELAREVDKLILSTLVQVRVNIPKDPAEKMLVYMWKNVDDWPGDRSRSVLQVVFSRFLDSMTYLSAYRGSFQGDKIQVAGLTKQQALAELRARGLTKR